MNNNIAKSEFVAWIRSFSGCDGGNPERSIWLCGIEYAGNGTPDTLTFGTVEEPPCFYQDDSERKNFLKYPYNRNAIKLLMAQAGATGTEEDFFKERKCFRRDSNYFKLNLYPVGFKDTKLTNWEDWLTEKTGLPNKVQYLDACTQYRFPFLREKILQYCPPLVICTGIGCYDKFKLAFGEPSDSDEQDNGPGHKRIRYFETNNKKTMVVVIHFLGGPNGLNSKLSLTATGRRLAEIKNIL